MSQSSRRSLFTGAAIAALAVLGCKRSDAPKIALLLPESKTARYETQDRPHFERQVKALCPECEVIYGNANQDAARQQTLAEAALTNGAKVLVLDAVDGAAAKVIAEKAKGQGCTVIAYDRLILNTDAIDYYVSFEAETIGRVQAQALLDALAGVAHPTIVMINGAPTDNNATLLKRGAHAVLDGKVTIAAEYDTPDWSPDKAQDEMTQALTALGTTHLDGVYAANDGTAGGVIAAAKAAGLSPLPPITGQDAEQAALQRVLAGEQYMTIYKAMRLEAETAAQFAVLAARGAPMPPGLATSKVNNGKREIPSVLLMPTAVTKANLKDTVLKDGFWTRQQLCTAAYADACRAAGL